VHSYANVWADEILILPLQKPKGQPIMVHLPYVMTSLVHDQDPCRISYKQSKQGHLVDCFTKKKLKNSPRVISCFLNKIFISNIF